MLEVNKIKIAVQASRSVLFGVIGAVFFCIEELSAAPDTWIQPCTDVMADNHDINQELLLLTAGGAGNRWNAMRAGGAHHADTLSNHFVQHYNNRTIHGYSAAQALRLTQHIVSQIVVGAQVIYVQKAIRNVAGGEWRVSQRDFAIQIVPATILAAHSAAWPVGYTSARNSSSTRWGTNHGYKWATSSVAACIHDWQSS
jgi:hypothetical protein